MAYGGRYKIYTENRMKWSGVLREIIMWRINTIRVGKRAWHIPDDDLMPSIEGLEQTGGRKRVGQVCECYDPLQIHSCGENKQHGFMRIACEWSTQVGTKTKRMISVSDQRRKWQPDLNQAQYTPVQARFRPASRQTRDGIVCFLSHTE